MRATHLTLGTGFTALLFLIFLPAFGQASQEAAGPAASSLTDIAISFKLDPRLSGPTYGGERWVSPPTMTGAATQDVVEARVAGVGARGEPIRINPKWNVSDPEMVSVSPHQGDQVKIKVKRAGESKLQVTSEGISKDLLIKAEISPITEAIQVRISQLNALQTAAPAAQGSSETRGTKVEAKQDAPAFKSKQEKLSYALGMNMASSLSKQAIKVDDDALVRGYRDAVSGRTLLSTQEVQTILLGLMEDARKIQEVKNPEARLAGGSDDVAEKNRQAGEAFLAENKSKEGVVTLPSGLQYKVVTAGNGKKPALDDKVVCNYHGTFIDGTEFDSSYKRGRSATFAVTGVIPGWREALQLMPVGSKWRIFIPSELAYGTRGTFVRSKKRGVAPKQHIGPNQTLIFEVELLSAEHKADSGHQLDQDPSAITDEAATLSKESDQ